MERLDDFVVGPQCEELDHYGYEEELNCYREFQAYKTRKESQRRRMIYEYADSYERPDWDDEYGV